MATSKHTNKKKTEPWREEIDIWEELVMEGAEAAVTHAKEVGPSKKTRAPRKKKIYETWKKAANQRREELNLEAIHNEVDLEPNVVDKGPWILNESNEPLGPSENDSDRKGPWQRETLISCLKEEIREIRMAMKNMADQNQMLLEIIKSGKVSSSNVTKPTYMKVS